MEFRNEILRGKISRIKLLLKQKGHVKIYVISKKCEEAVIQARKISVKNAAGEFKEHRIEKAKLDLEVNYCYKFKNWAMSRLTANTKRQQKPVAGAQSRTKHKTASIQTAR